MRALKKILQLIRRARLALEDRATEAAYRRIAESEEIYFAAAAWDWDEQPHDAPR